MIVIIDALCYAPVICMPRGRLGPGDTGAIAVCRKIALVANVYVLQCYLFMETDVKFCVLYLEPFLPAHTQYGLGMPYGPKSTHLVPLDGCPGMF